MGREIGELAGDGRHRYIAPLALRQPRADRVRRLGDAPQAGELLGQPPLVEGLRPHAPDSRPAQDLEPRGREPLRALAGAQVPGISLEQRLDLPARLPQTLRPFSEEGYRLRRGLSALGEHGLDLLPPRLEHRDRNLPAPVRGLTAFAEPPGNHRLDLLLVDVLLARTAHQGPGDREPAGLGAFHPVRFQADRSKLGKLAGPQLAGAQHLALLRQLEALDEAADRVGAAEVRALPDPVAVTQLKACTLQVPLARDLEMDPDPGRLQALDKPGERAGVRLRQRRCAPAA